MTLTIKQLKEKIKYLPDDMEVYTERIEDIYFEQYNWKTEKLVFQSDGVEDFDYTYIFKASQAHQEDDKFVIFSHY